MNTLPVASSLAEAVNVIGTFVVPMPKSTPFRWPWEDRLPAQDFNTPYLVSSL